MVWSRTNQLIVAAAERLGGRAEPLGARHTDYFLRLVHGERATIVSKTRSPFLTQVAQSLANNKHLSRELLARRGIPTVPDLLIDEGDDPRGPAAQAMLEKYGRLVVKPNWGNRGVGVTTDVRSLKMLARARTRAREIDLDEEVVVEPYVAGTNLRIAVIGGRFAAAAEVQRPVLVAGRRITEQIAALNEDPRRGSWATPSLRPMDRLEPEEDLLAHLRLHGLGLGDAPPEGVAIEITGEELEVIDRSEAVHPGWIAIAEQACGWLGVDVGGVDLRGPIEAFMGEPGRAGGRACLLEVNVLPALHLHALPTRGPGRPVFEAFVAYCLQLPGAPEPCARVRV
jgi:D-alanine-D-alanine ligase-like ATP-grasp enzyme